MEFFTNLNTEEEIYHKEIDKKIQTKKQISTVSITNPPCWRKTKVGSKQASKPLEDNKNKNNTMNNWLVPDNTIHLSHNGY